jgi:hypothetical protein
MAENGQKGKSPGRSRGFLPNLRKRGFAYLVLTQAPAAFDHSYW